MKRYILSIIALVLFATTFYAQEQTAAATNDSVPALTKKELRKQKVARRNLHYNILGGPSYTPDFGAVLGGSALMTFRMNPSDTTQLRSVVPMAIAFMFNGGINLFSKPQLFFKGDRFRIFGKFSYKNTEENFYGIGYNTNKDYVRSDSTSKYRYSGVQINPWFLFRLGNSNIFAGPQIDINYDHLTEPGKFLVDEPSYKEAGGTVNGYNNFNSGLGFLLTYDSRDVPANAYRGMYLDFRGMMYAKFIGSDQTFYRLEIDYRQYKSLGKRRVLAWTAQTKNVFGDVPANAYRGMYLDFRGMMYAKFIGSDQTFYRLEIDYRQYKSLGKRRVLAWTAQTKNVFGDVPLTQYALTGTPFDLRGYYMGQYRDKSSHVVMAEYRQMLNTDRSTWVKRMLNHIGFVAWTGCGFMGPTPGKIEGVLPNYGVGLRIEVQPRMNVRLDLGKNTVNNQMLFYFNMTEAF